MHELLILFLQVDTADPPFPRTTGDWWFGCEKRDTMKSSESDYQDDQLSDNSDAGEYDTSQPRDFDSRPIVPTNTNTSSGESADKKPWWKKVWNFLKG